MFLCFWTMVFLLEISLCFYVFGLEFLLGFIGFFKLMCLYLEVPKAYVNTFSHILNFISLKKEFSLFLVYASCSYQRLTSLWNLP